MLPASSPIHNSLQGAGKISLLSASPAFQLKGQVEKVIGLWVDISRGLFTPQNSQSYIAVIQVQLWTILHRTSGDHMAFCTAILKYDIFLNSGFLIFPLPLSSPPWPKLQGKSLENTCLRPSPTPRIVHCPVGAAMESHSGKCEWHCFLTEDFFPGSQLPSTSCNAKKWRDLE